MDQTHVHLLINHLPIFGSILGVMVLVHALWMDSKQTSMAAYNLFIVSAIGAGIAYFTGEAAEETVENIQGISENVIDIHEDVAVYALVSIIALGVLSILGHLSIIKDFKIYRSLAWLILLIGLVSFGLMARTGYTGGQIRHTELSSASFTQPQNGESGDED
ncbi:MAG TPA: hypothetical protein PK209_13025 [Saprospiraceae bacterium]|nr:hypothetical protein [Saprospiraceae bacterium]